MTNSKVTLALLGQELGHIKEEQSEMRTDVKDIKKLLTDGGNHFVELDDATAELKKRTDFYGKILWGTVSTLILTLFGIVGTLLGRLWKWF